MVALSQKKYEAAVIRRIFKGEPEAYRHIIEQYMPMVYAVALAHTGNIYLADKIVVATFKGSFEHLVSLTDPSRLGILLCAVAQGEAERLVGRRTADWNKPRKRQDNPPIDMKWVQSELIDPLNEELCSFTLQERKGILLNTFCGMSAKSIADTIKIEKKEAEEDLARTQENVEKALLGEVVNALFPEVNNKERLIAIMTEVAGPFVAEKAASESRMGMPKRKIAPLVITVSTVIVVAIGCYFGYRAFQGVTALRQFAPVAQPSASEPRKDPNGGATEDAAPIVPASYMLEGRVVDKRFSQDGIPGLKVSVNGQEAETDFYGAFVIRGVQGGQHDVTVSHNGVVLGNHSMNTRGRNSAIEIDVDHNVPARFLFQGRVFDQNTNNVIEHFEVTTCKDFPDMLQPYLINRFKEQQHPDGILNDRFVTLGDYTMYVRARGYAPRPFKFTIDENWDIHRVHEFPLLHGATLKATVYGPNELTIEGTSIMPRQGTIQGTLTGKIEYTRSDTYGQFSIHTLPIGVQSFLIYHMQHDTGRAIVELEPGETTQVKIRLPQKGALTGDITVNGHPTQFIEFQRLLSGSNLDLLRSVNYLSPGQYEVVIPPEPVTILAGVAPREDDLWYERRMELDAVVATGEPEPIWLDFNFASGQGSIHSEVSLRGQAPRAVFVELTYHYENGAECIAYELGATGAFTLNNLPLGSGLFGLYCSPRDMSKTDFVTARPLMERHERPFALDETQPQQQIDFTL